MIETTQQINDSFSFPKDQLNQVNNFSKRQMKSMFPTRIMAFDEFGEKLLDFEQNMVVLGGALTVLEKMWNVRSPLLIDTINNIMTINPEAQSSTELISQNNIVCLWGIGVGGSGDAFASVRDVKFYEREIGQNGQSIQMVPFRVVTSPLEGTDVGKYYLKKDYYNKHKTN